METNLRKKNSFLKDIYNIYSSEIKIILTLISIPLIIFIPYYIGRLFATIPYFASTINVEKDEFLQVLRTWIYGNAFILLITTATICIFGLIPVLVSIVKDNIMENMFNGCNDETIDLSNFTTDNITNMSNLFKNCEIESIDLSDFDTSNVKVKDNKNTNTLKLIKKMSYLPTTEEELKALNINTFDEFDKFMVDFFGIYEVGSSNVRLELSDKFQKCLKLLPLPETVAYLNNYKSLEATFYKVRYIQLRSEVLACKILGQEHSYRYTRDLELIQEDYESIEAEPKCLREVEWNDYLDNLKRLRKTVEDGTKATDGLCVQLSMEDCDIIRDLLSSEIDKVSSKHHLNS